MIRNWFTDDNVAVAGGSRHQSGIDNSLSAGCVVNANQWLPGFRLANNRGFFKRRMPRLGLSAIPPNIKRRISITEPEDTGSEKKMAVKFRLLPYQEDARDRWGCMLKDLFLNGWAGGLIAWYVKLAVSNVNGGFRFERMSTRWRRSPRMDDVSIGWIISKNKTYYFEEK